MNIFFWIALALFVLNQFFVLLFKLKKSKRYLTLAALFELPLAVLLLLSLLIFKLPDSVRLLTAGIISVIISNIIIFCYVKNKKPDLIQLLFAINLLIWNNFYFSSFYLYRIPSAFTSIFFISAALILVFLLFYLKEKIPLKYFLFILCYFCVTFFLYNSCVALFCGKRAYAALLFAGSILLIWELLDFSVKFPAFLLKNEIFFQKTFYIFSQLLILAGSVLLFYF